MKELTKAEEQVMQILWQVEKGFVKDIIADMPEPKPAYNTVSTIIRILETKGFVDHKAYGKNHEYFPLIAKDKYRSFFLQNFMGNYFGGSFERLVSFFANDKNMDISELDEMMNHIKLEMKDKNPNKKEND